MLRRAGINAKAYHVGRREWGKLMSQGSEEATRWKRASLYLKLRLAWKTDPQASLRKDQWKAGWKKFNVNSEEVKAEVSRQAGREAALPV